MSPAKQLAICLLCALPLCLTSNDVRSDLSGWDLIALNKIDPANLGYLTHSTMLVDGSGEVLWEWGDTNEKLSVFSIRKSLLSTLYGVAVAQGKIDINDTLDDLGIDDHQNLTVQEKQATVLDLLKSRSGIYRPAAYETPRMFNNRPQRGEYQPGEHWFYNNWDFNALNTIFELAAGQNVPEAFKEHIADPIGMDHFSTADVEYVYEEVSMHPAVTFRMTATDLAKFGLLMLRKGRWDNSQIISSEWVAESTKPHSDLGMFGGYGYSWWAAAHGDHLPRLTFPDGTYSARGSGEQIILVIPSLNAVWVHRTRVDSPDQEMMRVVDMAKLLTQVLATHSNGATFRDRRF